MNAIRLLIVDDHGVVRDGFKAMLSNAPGIDAILTASDAAEALQICRQAPPDLVMLDLRMPGMDGHGLLEILHAEWPALPVVILSAHDFPADVNLAKRHGASGFLGKSIDRGTLIESIHTVAAGGTCFLAGRPLAASDVDALTERELEILRHLGRGLSNDSIGRVIGVSGETVKSHLKNIFRKLGVMTRAEAVARAHEQMLI
jgi:DNA-binding NarL/FixJ family response regulator